MRKMLVVMAAVVLLSPLGAPAEDGRAALEGAKLLIEADAFTPPPPGTPPPSPANPFSVNLADNITRLGLFADQLLPLHGRMVPLIDLDKAIGRAP